MATKSQIPRMKKLLLTVIIALACSLFSFRSFAQAPETFSYQAVARDGGGQLVPNATVGVQFQLHSGAANGPVVYAETHAPTTNAQGLFSVHVGQGTPTSGTFAAIDWGATSVFVEVGLDPAGGTAYSTIGNQQLLSVPYALQANDAQHADMANSATHASSADTAAYAQQAGAATFADSAIHASSADTAAYAQQAGAATYADSAIHASSADTATYAQQAGAATFAGSATHASSADTAAYAQQAGPPGNSVGEMRYWNGNAWVTLVPGGHGDVLTMCNDVPRWGTCPVQGRLNAGETPCQLLQDGIPLDSLYGRSYMGGWIAYMDPYTCQGFVVATSNVPNQPYPDHSWGCFGTFIGATGAQVFTGDANTALIAANPCSNNAAAQVVSTFGPGWYLPSRDELYAIYTNVHLKGYGNMGTLIADWSSDRIERMGGGLHQLHLQRGME